MGGAAHHLPLRDAARPMQPASVPPAQRQPGERPWNLRALLESTATPFVIANYGPRDPIYRQGDPSDSVMHIERGRVWLAVTAPSGKEAVCGLLDANAFLGEEALVGRHKRRQSATAMTATRVLVVAKAHMKRLLRTRPDLRERFIAHLLARSTRLETDLSDQILHSSELRLARTLLVLANFDERHPRGGALPALSQEVIAEMVGTTRPRVNAFMGKFRKLGFIEEHDGVLHINPARLRVIPDVQRDRPQARP